jgi:hypothetical protein
MRWWWDLLCSKHGKKEKAYIWHKIMMCLLNVWHFLIHFMDGYYFCSGVIVSILASSVVDCGFWLFNTNSAIFQLYHGNNKLIFNEMMMRSALFKTCMLINSASSLKQHSADRPVFACLAEKCNSYGKCSKCTL